MKMNGYSPLTEKVSEGEKETDFFKTLLENSIIKNLPNHLKQYIVDQNYIAYAPVDHSVWRYVLRQNHRFLIDHAHDIYFEGLEKTGLQVESIPSIQQMNDILIKIGWAAVSVDGFIPPAAFMEFQAHRVLVIAADMRQIHHIEYTPSPDIIHEAAGHAPVIADPEYAEYLRKFGEVGSKAMSSKKDYELYEAIRKLSILKEARDADPKDIESAEKDLTFMQKNLGKPSEMALLSRLHWWTVEYGLIGELDSSKIYGAGLLSSIGEAASCLSPKVKKIPYDINTQNYTFDITTMQPHLFVTPDFKHLINVLEEFSSNMAYKTGGADAVKKAIECNNTSTVVLSSNLQLSGCFTDVTLDDSGEPIFIKTEGKSNLAYENIELPGHDFKTYPEGFLTPIGKLKNISKPLEDFTDQDLTDKNIKINKITKLEFQSGFIVEGLLLNYIRKNKNIILISFEQCTVSYKNKTFFEPHWEQYDLAVGEKIISVFSGAADKDAFDQISKVSKRRVLKYELDKKGTRLNNLYQRVRELRTGKCDNSIILQIWEETKINHPNAWLLPVEIYEYITTNNIYQNLQKDIKQYLLTMIKEKKELTKLINDGIYLAENPTKYKRTWKI